MRSMKKTATFPALIGACLLLSAPAWAQAPNAEFDTCLNNLRAPARAAGVQDATFAQHTQGLVADMTDRKGVV